MTEKKEQWIQSGYDPVKQAYILDRYVNGILVCTYSAYLNHRTRTFKCYPRRLGSFETLKGVEVIHENKVKSQLQS